MPLLINSNPRLIRDAKKTMNTIATPISEVIRRKGAPTFLALKMTCSVLIGANLQKISAAIDLS